MSFLFIIEGGDEKCCNVKELDSQAFVPALLCIQYIPRAWLQKYDFEK